MKEATARAYARQREQRKDLLPYGRWTCADGSQVLFNRYYAPMHRRARDGTLTAWPTPFLNHRRPGSETWVDWETQEWLYNDATPEPDKVRNAVKALAAWTIAPPKSWMKNYG